MKVNKGLGPESVLSLSSRMDVVDHKSGKERALETFALIGWLWFLWWLATQNVPIP